MRLAGLGIGLVLVTLLAACGSATAPNRLDTASAGAPAIPSASAGVEVVGVPGTGGTDPTIGVPCTADEQCIDGFDCTVDRCDAALGRCRHEPDDAPCDDLEYCNGIERCDPRLGCRPGAAVACSDGNACTLDACDEPTRSCLHEPRDADGDGDPDGNCFAGADCDDGDPLVSSQAEEICDNSIDDDCDGEVDEESCSAADHDVCADALEISASGTTSIALAGARNDYAATCAGDDWRDVVVAILLDAASDVDLRVKSPGVVALAAQELCGDAATERGCALSVPAATGGNLARLRLHDVGPGAVPVTVFGPDIEPVELEVEVGEPTAPASNETCGTAVPIEPGTSVDVPLVGAAADLAVSCLGWEGDLVYSVELAETSDLEVFAASRDGLGEPLVAILDDACDEHTCGRGAPAAARAGALPPGRHYVAVSATAPTDVTLVVNVLPPAPALAGDTCDDPLPMEAGTRRALELRAAADDLSPPCGDPASDLVVGLTVAESVDLLALLRTSADDAGTLALAPPGCDGEMFGCASGTDSPVRTLVRGLSPGEHAVVVESRDANPVELALLTHPSVAPVLVAFADTCDEAVAVPSTGATFIGTTEGAVDDYPASCDAPADGGPHAPDQVLRLDLADRARVVLDARDSAFATLVSVRRGPDCPGEEVTFACSPSYGAERSFLDLVLDGGTYWIQVDGYRGAAGSWTLDVFFGAP